MKRFNVVNGLYVVAITIISLFTAYQEASALGTMTGHARHVRATGHPEQGYIELYEYDLWLGADGESQNQVRRAGAPPNGPITSDGFYSFDAPAGIYSLLLHQPEWYPRPKVLHGLTVVNNQTVTVNPEPATDYAMSFGTKSAPWGNSPYDSGTTWHQTFIALSTSLTRVEFKVAGENPPNINLSIHHDNGNSNPENWPQVGSTRVVRNVSNDKDNWIGWLSGEMPVTPGERYAVRLRDNSGLNQTINCYVHRDSIGPGYDNGTGYRDGAAQPYDLYMVIGGDSDGTLVSYSKRVDHKPAGEGGWAGVWGQTWKAKGRALAGMDLFAGGDEGSGIIARISVYENNPAGAKVGISKISNTAWWGPGVGIFGASWAPGEVPLTPGQTYYLEVAAQLPSTGFNPMPFTESEDNYPDGMAYQSSAPRANLDLEMTIIEYVQGATLPTPTPSPTPILAPNLIKNGDLELGQTGTTGEPHPDFWTNWESRSTAHWYNAGFGRNGTRGARVIGGSINGTQIQGGIYQRVDGLSSAKQYQFTAWASATDITGTGHGTYLGYDLTGQTGNPFAPSVVWIEMVSIGNTFQQYISPPLRPVAESMSFWSRGENTDTSDIFFADFDDFVLQEIVVGPTSTPQPSATPTSSPTITPPPTATPGPVNETSYLLFLMSENWYNESNYPAILDRDTSGRVDEVDLLDLLDEWMRP